MFSNNMIKKFQANLTGFKSDISNVKKSLQNNQEKNEVIMNILAEIKSEVLKTNASK